MSRFVFNPITSKFDLISNPPKPQVFVERLQETFIAGEQLSALRFVYSYNDEGIVKLADYNFLDSSRVIGITVSAALAGAEVPVTLFGKVEDDFFSASANSIYYLTTQGQITSTPPDGHGNSVKVGYSLKPGSIFIKIEQPVSLA